jgi:hypothetical protein
MTVSGPSLTVSRQGDCRGPERESICGCGDRANYRTQEVLDVLLQDAVSGTPGYVLSINYRQYIFLD